MAKVTLTIEDTEDGMSMNIDDLNPGVTLEMAMSNPTPAEGLAFTLIALASEMGKIAVGKIIDDAEYHKDVIA